MQRWERKPSHKVGVARRHSSNTVMHLAARSGDVSAQYALGVIYERGKSVKQDWAQAAKW